MEKISLLPGSAFDLNANNDAKSFCGDAKVKAKKVMKSMGDIILRLCG